MKKIKDLIKMLHEDGATEEEIGIVLEEMTTSASKDLFIHILSLINEDELKLIDEVAEDEDRVFQLVDEMYQKYEGKTTEQVVDEINERFVDSFLEGYTS